MSDVGDKEYGTKLWEKFGDIPVDNDGCIEGPFIHLPTVNYPTRSIGRLHRPLRRT